jgi:hypothetical protein
VQEVGFVVAWKEWSCSMHLTIRRTLVRHALTDTTFELAR